MLKKKRNILIVIIVSAAMLTIGGIRIILVERTYQTNKPILEACIETGGTVVIGPQHFWSLTSATCEES